MSQQRLRVLAAAIVLVPVLGFPLATMAGGTPHFPSRDDCARVPGEGTAGALEVVYGRLDDRVAADTLLAQVTSVGFVGAEIALDACGRWKVSYDAIESLAQGDALVEQVRRAGFDARVEIEG